MENKFKTNIKCSGCVASSTYHLNTALGENNWEVDIEDPNKTLTVVTPESVDPNVVVQTVNNAGFRAEQIS